MFGNKPKTKDEKTTREFVTISEIKDTVIITKDNVLLSLIEVLPTNFELKSKEEQDAAVQGFQAFINSVDFSLQVFINSRKLNIGPYLKTIGGLAEKQNNELLKIQAAGYSKFVKGLTELANIMSKKFYVVAPFYPPLSIKKSGILNIFSSNKTSNTVEDADFVLYKEQLDQRVSLLIEGISGMGLATRLLSDRDEIFDLYNSLFNPEKV